jgi:hypothetical protein
MVLFVHSISSRKTGQIDSLVDNFLSVLWPVRSACRDQQISSHQCLGIGTSR